MTGPEPSLRAALTHLGLADGADREAVVHAYRRLARMIHPDLSDAPDAKARFSALEAAYRRALVGAERAVMEPTGSSTVPITVHEDLTPRRAAAEPGGRRSLVIGDAILVHPPIVAGPVRVVPPAFHPQATQRDRREP